MKLSYSSTIKFKTCRKKFYYSNVLEIEPIEIAPPLSFGGAVHKGLETYYKHGNNKKLIYDSVIDYYLENSIDPDDMVFSLLDRYIEHYDPEPFEVIQIEEPFEVNIINPCSGHKSRNHTFRGIFDGLVKWDGLYWLLEHKTTSSIGNRYKKKLTIDNQSIAYIEALQRHLNIKIQGVIYNVILKDIPKYPSELARGGLSKAKNQNTTYDLYLEKVAQKGYNKLLYADILEHLKNNQKEFFYRERIVFTQSDFEEWKRELWDIQKNVSEAKVNNQYYKNTSQCIIFGTCQFFDICTAVHPESVIQASYKRRER